MRLLMDWKQLDSRILRVDLVVEFVLEVTDVFGTFVLDPDKADRLFHGLPVGAERAIFRNNVLPSQEFCNRFVDQRVKDLGTCLMAAHHVGGFGFDHMPVLIAATAHQTSERNHRERFEPITTMHGIPFPRNNQQLPQIVQLLAIADKRNIGNPASEDRDDPSQNLDR